MKIFVFFSIVAKYFDFATIVLEAFPSYIPNKNLLLISYLNVHVYATSISIILLN